MRAVNYEIKRNENECFSATLCSIAPLFEERYKSLLQSSNITPCLVLDINSVRGRVKPTVCSRVLRDLKRGNITDPVRFMAETKHSVYLFDFSALEFWYNGKEIYVTDKEELYLYRRFILKECVYDANRIATSMAKRIGVWFLRDI